MFCLCVGRGAVRRLLASLGDGSGLHQLGCGKAAMIIIIQQRASFDMMLIASVLLGPAEETARAPPYL